MFCADEDDASLKTPIVRPNDVLDIEISPVARAIPCSWQAGIECKNVVHRTPAKSSKAKDRKVTRGQNLYSTKKQLASQMKRGDPFLPSVFPDENPIADYTVKKNSRKKPSDCKCKGLGYNLSPSALLPEEMRQQWGVGMFGKPSLAKANSIAVSSTVSAPLVVTPTARDNETKRTPTNVIRNPTGCASSTCCVLRCKNCMKEPCLCAELFAKHESFRIPECHDRRKQKPNTKGLSFRGKENKNPGPLVLGSTTSASVLKRIACYNSKDNSNIISTSNFHRSSVNSVSANGPSGSVEMNGYKCNISVAQSNLGGSRCSGLNGNVACGVKTYSSLSAREDIALTPRVRHRHQTMPPRRLLTNVSSSPILSNAGLGGTVSAYEAKASLSRSGTQMLMFGAHGCACENCRRRASLMSRMEALGFSTSNTQQMSPFLYSTSQRYQTASLHSSLPTSGRYAPYNVPTYSYSRESGSIYGSPERYQCSSPPYFEYSDSPGRRRQPFVSTPLSMAHEMNKVDISFLDTENSMPSPPSTNYIDDITDLSIKDTVDFFVSMKSPFVNSSPSPSSDTSSGIYSSLSPGERSTSPFYNNSSSSCFCNSGMCPSSYSLTSQRRDNIYVEPSSHKFISTDGSTQPMSLLYSSLVSDLEDELRCAIENIPTS